jgi:hypothetical protein
VHPTPNKTGQDRLGNISKAFGGLQQERLEWRGTRITTSMTSLRYPPIRKSANLITSALRQTPKAKAKPKYHTPSPSYFFTLTLSLSSRTYRLPGSIQSPHNPQQPRLKLPHLLNARSLVRSTSFRRPLHNPQLFPSLLKLSPFLSSAASSSLNACLSIAGFSRRIAVSCNVRFSVFWYRAVTASWRRWS